MGAVAGALALAAGGNVMLAAAAVEPVADAGNSLAPWLTGGGSAAAVAGLVYVARMVVKGDLVPRPVEQREADSARRKEELLQLGKQLAELAHEAQARETVLANLGGEAVRSLGRQEELQRHQEDLQRQLSDELRRWREDRPASWRRRDRDQDGTT